MSIRDEKMTQRDRVTEGEQLNGLRDIKKGEDAKHLPLEKKLLFPAYRAGVTTLVKYFVSFICPIEPRKSVNTYPIEGRPYVSCVEPVAGKHTEVL